jgi:hypothetical protein
MLLRACALACGSSSFGLIEATPYNFLEDGADDRFQDGHTPVGFTRRTIPGWSWSE